MLWRISENRSVECLQAPGSEAQEIHQSANYQPVIYQSANA
jgi:hypothetical protein